MSYKFDLSRGEEILLKVAAISTAVLGLVGVYTFYRNNIWEPKVDILNVNYVEGVASLVVNGKPFLLKGDSTYLISSEWGIKFGFTFTKDGKRIYDRIELLKRGMVKKILSHA
jgi:hypothetical protein